MYNFVCPGCKSKSVSESLVYHATSEEFRHKKILTCQQCNLKSIFPMPTAAELGNYYRNYWEKHDVAGLNELFASQARARYEFIEKFLADNIKLRVLDVGAGFGLIRTHFCNDVEYDAVEVDPDAIESLNSCIKANNIYANVNAAPGCYDLIILSHIIEHLIDPLGFLSEVKEKLNDQGIVFVEVPNKDYMYKTNNEPHLIFFQPETLVTIIEKAGLNVIECNTCGMNIADLKMNKRNNMALLRSIVRKFIPNVLLRKANIERNRSYINNNLVISVSHYGEDRQWIRLVAKRFESAECRPQK